MIKLAANHTRTSVIIPTLNHPDLLAACIASFRQTVPPHDCELIIVDDGSGQAESGQIRLMAAEYGCRLIRHDRRLGFARAVNAGIRAAAGEYILLVNNDIVFTQEGWLGQLIGTAEQSGNIGIVGCRLLYGNGTIQHAGGILFPHKHYDHLFRGMPADFGPAQMTYEVPAVTAALMLIKKQVIADIGLFAEEYPLSFEDVDYCLRARKAGWRVVYTGKAAAQHDEGSTRGNKAERKPPAWEREELQSYQLFWSRWLPFQSIKPLDGIAVLIAWECTEEERDGHVIAVIRQSLAEMGCRTFLEISPEINRGQLASFCKNTMEQHAIASAVILTNTDAVQRRADPASIEAIPVVAVEAHLWTEGPTPEDMYRMVNLVSAALDLPKGKSKHVEAEGQHHETDGNSARL